jgi:hypothetical protein
MEIMLNSTEQHIYVFDNFFPDWLVGIIDSRMQAEPWWLGHYGDATDPNQSPIFGCDYVAAGNPTKPGYSSGKIPFVAQVVEDAIQRELPNRIPGWQYKSTWRIRANGQLPGQQTGEHADGTGFGHWSVVYHINDSDGPTTFFATNLKTKERAIREVEFKKGRLILFPSYYWHQAYAPTKNWRMTYGFVVIAKTPWDQEIWHSSATGN